MRGLAELRVKESDRLAGDRDGASRPAASRSRSRATTLIVEGDGGPPAGGATIATRLDHRIAMAFLVLGLGGEIAGADRRRAPPSPPAFPASCR